jgi:hypothetical protein
LISSICLSLLIRNGKHKFAPFCSPFRFSTFHFAASVFCHSFSHSPSSTIMSNATILSPSLRPRRSASSRSSSRQSNMGQLSQRQNELKGAHDTLSPCVGLVGEEDTTFVHDSDEGSFLPASSASPPPSAVSRAVSCAVSVSSSHGDFVAGARDSLSAAHQSPPVLSVESPLVLSVQPSQHPPDGATSATDAHSWTIRRLQERLSSIHMDEVYLIAADYSRPTEERSWYYRLWADLNERETRVQGALLQLLPRRDPYLDHYATLVREHWARRPVAGSS